MRLFRLLSMAAVLMLAICGPHMASAAVTDCKATGSQTLTLSPCPISKPIKDGSSIHVSIQGAFTTKGLTQAYIAVTDPGFVVSRPSFRIYPLSFGRFGIAFDTDPGLGLGKHVNALDVKLCFDSGCKNVLAEAHLPYSFNVVVPPAISKLSPAQITVGAAPFTLKVYGRFIEGDKIVFGTSALSTTFVSAFQLTATVNLHAVTAGKIYKVSVIGLNGIGSDPVSFTLGNPVPRLKMLTPNSAQALGTNFATYVITITGTGFMAGSKIKFTGSTVSTTFVSSTKLTAKVNTDNAATGAIHNVTVTNPGPGGGTSKPMVFTVRNNAPSITSLSSSSIPIIASGVGITIHGAGLQYNSVVTIGGVIYPSSVTDSTLTQLDVAIPGNTFTIGTELPVVVTNPEPGGGTSNATTLAVNNPAPSLHWISPVQAYAGSGDMIIMVRASNLNSTTQLEWNGVPLQGTTMTTVPFLGQFLQATVPAADLATAGSAVVALVTPSPGGGTSQASFTVLQHPPEIDSMSPGFIAPGSGDFTLALYGVDFDPGATVYWNSSPLSTTYVSASELQATVPTADVTDAGVAKLTVVNPDTAGGASQPASLAVDASGTSVQALAQPLNDIEWDPWRFLLYGTTHAADPSYPHGIVSIDPITVGVVASTSTSPLVEGHLLSLSGDGRALYVSLAAPWGIARYALPGLAYAGNLALFTGGSSNIIASGMRASPLYSHVVAVTTLPNGLASSNDGALVFDDTDEVGYLSQDETWDAMAWSPDGLTLYAGDVLDSPKSFMTGSYSITARGTQSFQSSGNLWAGGPMHVDAASGLIYADGSPSVVNPAGPSVVATFPVSGVMMPDSSLGCAYFITQTQAQIDAATGDWTLSCYSTADQSLTRSLVIPAVNGTPTKMLRWGNEGLAFITDAGYIYFVSGQVVTGN